MKNDKHIRIEQLEKVETERKRFGYKSFSEFVNAAIMHFLGWLSKTK